MTTKKTTKAAAPKKKPAGKKPAKREELRRRTMELPVKLSRAELDQAKAHLVEATRARADAEADLNDRKEDWKAEQKRLQAAITSTTFDVEKTTRMIETKEDVRDVEVVDYLDGMNVVAIRQDTGDIVAERPADEHERQLALPAEDAAP